MIIMAFEKEGDVKLLGSSQEPEGHRKIPGASLSAQDSALVTRCPCVALLGSSQP
jgi:hypothetical protein